MDSIAADYQQFVQQKQASADPRVTKELAKLTQPPLQIAELDQPEQDWLIKRYEYARLTVDLLDLELRSLREANDDWKGLVESVLPVAQRLPDRVWLTSGAVVRAERKAKKAEVDSFNPFAFAALLFFWPVVIPIVITCNLALWLRKLLTDIPTSKPSPDSVLRAAIVKSDKTYRDLEALEEYAVAVAQHIDKVLGVRARNELAAWIAARNAAISDGRLELIDRSRGLILA